jgi:hypothetical protein
MDNAYQLDPFTEVINIQFGGTAWLLINISIAGGSQTDPTPPPYGEFSLTPPSGSKLLDQKTISKTQGSATVPNDFYFPWYSEGADVPTVSNYRTIQPGHAGNLLFAWSVTDTLRGFPDDPAFPPPDKSFWYSTAAKAQVAVNFLMPPISAGSGQNGFYFASLGDFLSDTFTRTSDLPMTYKVQVVHDPISEAHTNFNVQFLIAVPQKATTVQLTVEVPGESGAIGWASIFTPDGSNKSIKNIAQLVGPADQSVGSFQAGATHTFTITTTGKPGEGTISVDGVSGTAPGLPANAPLPG